MQTAYNALNTAVIVDKNFKDFRKGDLLCIETVNVPDCTPINKTLIKRAKEKGCHICVDNSVKCVINQNKFDFEPDYILESLSKFVNGFNTSLIGFLYCKNRKLQRKILTTKQRLGFQTNARDTFLTCCGLQTLNLRMKKIQETAKKVKAFLKKENVVFTCIEDSGLFYIKVLPNLERDYVYNTILSCTCIQLVCSFGLTFTACDHYRDNFNLIRISLGLEDFDDLLPDLLRLRSIMRDYY